MIPSLGQYLRVSFQKIDFCSTREYSIIPWASILTYFAKYLKILGHLS